jgi:hypothetical protein
MSPFIGSFSGMSARGYGDLLFKSSAAPIIGAYDALATITVPSGGASSITFSGIPSTYTHLQIRGSFNQGGGNWLGLNYNGDSTAGAYQWHYIAADGSSASGGYSGSSSATGTVTAYNNNSTAYCGFILDILDYANSNKTKVGRVITGYDANGSGELMLLSNLWTNTAPVNKIVLSTSATNLAQYSTFSLYGVK